MFNNNKSINNTTGNTGRMLNLPESPTISEFFLHPKSYRPKAEFMTEHIEEETLLTHGIKTQNVDAVEVLLTFGADPNTPSRKGVAPISAAAHKGNTHIMKLLINAGAVVNAMNSTGSTALIQAAHFGHLEAVQLLLANNAASDFANVKGTTALMRASQEGHVEIAGCLIESGVDVNRKNHEGMNALMLASQRGHAEIVHVLVRAGAQMDEQTAQGSTALMLACKRGHEKCAEVLVSMGAEIFMRDKRNRTARDTATRRNHHGLLIWLDTQVQVRRIQEGRQPQRHSQLIAMRDAHLQGRLRLNSAVSYTYSLFRAVKHTKHSVPFEAAPLGEIASVVKFSSEEKNSVSFTTAIDDMKLLRQFTESPASPVSKRYERPQGSNGQGNIIPVVSTSPHDALSQLSNLVEIECCRNSVAERMPVYRNSAQLAKRVEGYSDWQWPILLQRCMGLTAGLFEQILEYLPSPRVWQWSLLRLKRRCKLAPLRAVQDLSIIMDEILKDSVIFATQDQSNLLMKLNQSPQIHEFMLQDMCMPEPLLESLCNYADTQSILKRCTEADISFKPQFARQMLTTAVSLYRWHRARTNVLKAIGNQSSHPLAAGGTLSALAGLLKLRLTSGESGSDTAPNITSNVSADGTMGQDDLEDYDDYDDDGELMEVTDVGAEEGSDLEEGDEYIAVNEPDNGNEPVLMDLTAEEENDGIEQEILDDSDFEHNGNGSFP